MGKKAIVTGGAGFIGSHLVDALISKGYRVTVYDNLSTGKREYVNPKAKFIKADLTKPLRFEPAEVVIHLAALPRIERSFAEPLSTHESNVTATLNVLQGATEAKAKRFIYSSSSSVYGKLAKKDLPVKENHPLHPESPYAAQKLMGEIYCQLFAKISPMDVVLLRYFNVYGPRQPQEGAYKLVIPIFLAQREAGKPLTIFGSGNQTRDFTHVSDVVNATVKATETKSRFHGEIINVGSGKPTSIRQLAKIIGGNIRYVKPNPRASWEERHKYADITKAKRILGWSPKISLMQGITALIKKE